MSVMTSYVPHAPIVIMSNSDFASQGFPGSGTVNDPYIIQGFNITSTETCISIRDTTAYFEIRGCLISSNPQSNNPGIKLDNVINGAIHHCIIENHYDGVLLLNSPGITLMRNTASYNTHCGFSLQVSGTATLLSNEARANSLGFSLFQSSFSTLTNNTSDGDDEYGFYILQSMSCELRGNLAIGSYGTGFYLSSRFPVLIGNNASYNGQNGFEISACESATLINNTAAGNIETGFYVAQSDDCTLYGNVAEYNRHGLQIYLSSQCNATDNTFIDSGVMLFGSSLSQWSHTMTGNTVNGKPLGYFKNLTGGTVDGSLYGQVILANCTDVTVKDGVFPHASVGISVGFSSTCTLSNNTSSESYWGFYLRSSTSCTLTNNTAFRNEQIGFYLQGSPSCLLTNNLAVGHAQAGFYLYDSAFTTLTNNTSTESVVGFRIYMSGFCVLSHNSAIDITSAGFYVFLSQSLTFENNYASKSAYGFFLEQCTSLTLSKNIAYRNVQNGFYVYLSNAISLLGNTIIEGERGVYLYRSPSCVLTNNTFSGSGLFIDGVSITQWLHTMTGNTVNGKPLGYFKNLTGGTVDGSLYGQVILANCTNVSVSNGVFSWASVGISVGFSSYCTLTNNTVSLNQNAGIRVYFSSNCIVNDNNATRNVSWGIVVEYSDKVTLVNNIVSWSSIGLGILYSSQCTVLLSTATDNLHYGIAIGWSSGCVLYENRIGYNILKNARDDGSSNTWDDGVSKGNYWSDYSGTGTYPIMGAAGSVDRYPNVLDIRPPRIEGPPDIEYEFGTVGHMIYWLPEDDHPGNYSIYRDGSLVASGQWNSSGITVGVSGLDVGTYNYTLLVFDAYSNWARDTVIVRVVDTTAPLVTGPDDMQYECGTTGNLITWIASDPHPQQYEIYRNGSLVSSGGWTSPTIVVNVDGLAPGTYNYTLVVFDAYDNQANDMVLVTVVDTTAPTIDSPDDLQYELGTTGHSIRWNPSDLNPERYEVYRDGLLVDSGVWDGSDITVNIDGLAVGIYNYTIVVYDTSGNWVSDTVFVTVLSQDMTMIAALGIIAFAVGVVVVVFVVRPQLRKRP
ncbi:MAG: NosD domain-containing protein [Candidatus Thorarchaeota archaeon]